MGTSFPPKWVLLPIRKDGHAPYAPEVANGGDGGYISMISPDGDMQGAPFPSAIPGRPLLGHLSAMRRDMLGFLTQVAREHGDVVGLRLGPRRAVLLSAPEHIHQVLVRDRRAFRRSMAYRLIERVTGEGLFTSDGDMWKRSRRMLQPAFHRDAISGYAETMTRRTQRMLGTWEDGSRRDIHKEMTLLTLGIVTETLLGEDIDDEVGREVAAAVGSSVDLVQLLVSGLSSLLPSWLPTPTNVRLRKQVRRLDRVLYGVIDRQRVDQDGSRCILSILLQLQDEEDGTRLSDSELRNEAMTLFMAGHETTAIALTWTFHLLSLHPPAAESLVDELDRILGGRVPTATDLARLSFTNAVVAESLRLYPPGYTISRESIEDVVIGGYRIPKKTLVGLSQWVVHRDPRFFSDPEEFRPERWTGDLEKRLPKYAYFPFGAGQRYCIGAEFAKMEAVLVLATVMQRYHLRPVSGPRAVPEAAVTLRPKYGLPMTVHERTQ